MTVASTSSRATMSSASPCVMSTGVARSLAAGERGSGRGAGSGGLVGLSGVGAAAVPGRKDAETATQLPNAEPPLHDARTADISDN